MLKHLLRLMEASGGFSASIRIEKESEVIIKGDFRSMIMAAAALFEEEKRRQDDERNNELATQAESLK